MTEGDVLFDIGPRLSLWNVVVFSAPDGFHHAKAVALLRGAKRGDAATEPRADAMRSLTSIMFSGAAFTSQRESQEFESRALG